MRAIVCNAGWVYFGNGLQASKQLKFAGTKTMEGRLCIVGAAFFVVIVDVRLGGE